MHLSFCKITETHLESDTSTGIYKYTLFYNLQLDSSREIYKHTLLKKYKYTPNLGIL